MPPSRVSQRWGAFLALPVGGVPSASVVHHGYCGDPCGEPVPMDEVGEAKLREEPPEAQAATDDDPVLHSPIPPAAPVSPPTEPRRGWLDRIPGYTVPLLLIGIPLLIALASRIWPEQVYDQIVWKYYWGPIKADAEGG